MDENNESGDECLEGESRQDSPGIFEASDRSEEEDSQQDFFEVFGTDDVREAVRVVFGAKFAEHWLNAKGGGGVCGSDETPDDLIKAGRENLIWEELMRRACGVTA